MVLTVTADDLDMGAIGEVRYRITSEFDAAGSFEVNETTGGVYVNSTLDFDFRYGCIQDTCDTSCYYLGKNGTQ